MNNTPDTQHDDERGRRRKALLAGGLVLGLGAAVTLAAWSDDVIANGLFNTGTFELQGALDGTTFQDYDVENRDGGGQAASLSFELDATQMSPGQTVYAPLTIATSANSSLSGTFTLADVTADGGGLDSVLTYKIYNTENGTHGANCSPTAAPTGTAWAGGDSAVVNAVAGTNSPLPVGANQGAPKQAMCFAVTLGDPSKTAEANQTAVQAAIDADSDGNHATTVTWTFTGVSNDV